MTLILTVANSSGVYQSSDYQLTDSQGNPVTDRAGSKQLQAMFEGMELRLAFTGVAAGGRNREPTINQLSDELQALLPKRPNLQEICEALRKRSVAITSPSGSSGWLELVLTVAEVGKPLRVAVVSNVDWGTSGPKAKPQFTIAIHRIRKPFHLISGCRPSVSVMQRYRLRALAEDPSRLPKEVMRVLAEINAIAAESSNGYVSEGCWVSSQVVDSCGVLRSAGFNEGQHAGMISSLLGGSDVAEFVKENFRTAPGKQLSIVQNAGAIYAPGKSTPIAAPAPPGKPRRITLSGSSLSAILHSPEGRQSSEITISQLSSPFSIRFNEGLAVPFATVTVRGIAPIGSPVARPLLPWPQLRVPIFVDGAPVSKGWPYSIGYWIADKKHNLVITSVHWSIRDVPFLGPNDQISVVAPSMPVQFAWGEEEEPRPAILHARVRWQARV